MSKSLCESSLHSRDTRNNTSSKTKEKTDQKKKKKKKKKPNASTMDLDENSKDDGAICNKSKGVSYYPFLTYKRMHPQWTLMKTATMMVQYGNKSKGVSYYPFLTYKRNHDKIFYYKYFRPYSHDYRRLRMEEECQFPQGELHSTKCEWYEPETIYILDTQGDISASEEAAQQKIYHMYLNTLNNPPEHCGCGTAAEIAYMGHNTGCVEFQYIHERESYEVLLAILKMRKKVTFSKGSKSKSKRHRLHSPIINEEGKGDAEVPKMQKVPKAKLQPNLSQKPTAVVTPNATYTHPNDPPKSLPEIVTEYNDVTDFPGEGVDDQMPPL